MSAARHVRTKGTGGGEGRPGFSGSGDGQVDSLLSSRANKSAANPSSLQSLRWKWNQKPQAIQPVTMDGKDYFVMLLSEWAMGLLRKLAWKEKRHRERWEARYQSDYPTPATLDNFLPRICRKISPQPKGAQR